jgi:hypothetical protein
LSSPHLLIHFPETVITVKFRAGNHGMGEGMEIRNPNAETRKKAEIRRRKLPAWNSKLLPLSLQRNAITALEFGHFPG